MRHLIISDIHSNLEALESCLKLAEGRYDQVLCLGDIVGYGPDPNTVIERVRAIAHIAVRGNHDKACAGLMDLDWFNAIARVAAEWTRGQLTPHNFTFIRALPAGPVRADGFELVHGSPADEDEYITEAFEALPAFEAALAPMVFFGHTHHQGGFLLEPGGDFKAIETRLGPEQEAVEFVLDSRVRYLINPGSVGQPRDGDWRAAFAIYDDAQSNVDFFRANYDIQTTQRKMRGHNLPEPLVRRLAAGR